MDIYKMGAVKTRFIWRHAPLILDKVVKER